MQSHQSDSSIFSIWLELCSSVCVCAYFHTYPTAFWALCIQLITKDKYQARISILKSYWMPSWQISHFSFFGIFVDGQRWYKNDVFFSTIVSKWNVKSIQAIGEWSHSLGANPSDTIPSHYCARAWTLIVCEWVRVLTWIVWCYLKCHSVMCGIYLVRICIHAQATAKYIILANFARSMSRKRVRNCVCVIKMRQFSKFCRKRNRFNIIKVIE